MKSDAPSPNRCGLDTVEIARIEKLLLNKSTEDLEKLFSRQELDDAGTGAGRAASLAARFAAKEACCKLFPRETALGLIDPCDFNVQRDAYGAPKMQSSARAQAVLDRHRLAGLRVSLTHTDSSASAIVWADPRTTDVPWFGKAVYYLLPYRRGVVLENLRRVFGEVVPSDEIRKLAQAYYGHFVRFAFEFFKHRFMSAERRKSYVRVENIETALQAYRQGKGVLLLAGHFGNWEVATVAGISQFPQFKGWFHFVRRPLKPQLLNEFVNRRFQKAGFGSIAKRGSLDTILDLLTKGAVVLYVFDQHAGKKDGVLVDFFGQPANTFKSLAILALNTGAPVLPAYCCREPDGTHVLRFEEPLPLIECENVSEAIRRNTQAYNSALERMLLRHPEQWIWMHKRWKVGAAGKVR
jgi:KDO2-lipid IV(A) lauroyltransferase